MATEPYSIAPEILRMLPAIAGATNRAVEEATAGFRKRFGAILWLLYFSEPVTLENRQQVKCLKRVEVVSGIQRWFACSPKSANGDVSDAKLHNILFAT